MRCKARGSDVERQKRKTWPMHCTQETHGSSCGRMPPPLPPSRQGRPTGQVIWTLAPSVSFGSESCKPDNLTAISAKGAISPEYTRHHFPRPWGAIKLPFGSPVPTLTFSLPVLFGDSRTLTPKSVPHLGHADSNSEQNGRPNRHVQTWPTSSK